MVKNYNLTLNYHPDKANSVVDAQVKELSPVKFALDDQERAYKGVREIEVRSNLISKYCKRCCSYSHSYSRVARKNKQCTEDG